MGFSYFPHTQEDIKKMMDRTGILSIDDLYADVPQEYIFDGDFELPEAKSEQEVRAVFDNLAEKNIRLKIFAGGGAYDHYSPAVVPYIISRSEYLTAYTPYQAEISQGTLRYIFEYQSMITELTGMDCSNASMYDGATAAAEAMMMCIASTKKKSRILLSSTLLPQVMRVVETYASFNGIEVEVIASEDGATDIASLETLLGDDSVAGAIVPAVNRYGIVEDLSGFAEKLHAKKALLAVYADPSALAVLRTPAEWDADIACGEAQSLGLPLSFGGPYLGYLACRKDYLRKLPGRIVGQTVDKDGKRAFVLTLQAREQHIRREKATSNICSNQSLMALYVTVYLSLMGPEGLVRVNELSSQGAHYLYDRLLDSRLFEKVFDKPFLKEFVLRPLVPTDKLQEHLVRNGFFGALEIEKGLVSFCVTEKRTKEETDALVDCINSLKI